jgi:hypothetical protein
MSAFSASAEKVFSRMSLRKPPVDITHGNRVFAQLEV